MAKGTNGGAAAKAKPKTKAAATAVAKKTVKTRSRSKTAPEVKYITDMSEAELKKLRLKFDREADEFLARQAALGVKEPKPKVVPLAEVEVLAAKAVKKIKATKKLSATQKARRLEMVARTLSNARGWGGLSKCGALGLTEMHVPTEPYDRRLLER